MQCHSLAHARSLALLRRLLFPCITVSLSLVRPIIEMGFEEASGDFSAGGPTELRPTEGEREAMLALL